jgi:hypothetical protein
MIRVVSRKGMKRAEGSVELALSPLRLRFVAARAPMPKKKGAGGGPTPPPGQALTATTAHGGSAAYGIGAPSPSLPPCLPACLAVTLGCRYLVYLADPAAGPEAR